MKTGQSAPHWAGLGETTFVAGIRFLAAVERVLGRWPFRVCLAPVVLGHWLFNRTARRASLQYLQRLHAGHAVFSRPPGIGASLRHFSLFAETLLDKLLAARGQYPLEQVESQPEAILDHIARGEGGLIVTAHVGCLELCEAMAAAIPEFRLTALVHTAHAEEFNRLLRRFSPDGRVELLQVTTLDVATATLLGERVARGEFIAIAGDRIPVGGGRCVRTPFLGHPAPFPVGPWVLAAALDCTVFTLACTHRGAGYRVDLQRFADRIVLPRNTRMAALTLHVEHYAAWLEACLKGSPLDWFNFFPFWDQVPHDSNAQ